MTIMRPGNFNNSIIPTFHIRGELREGIFVRRLNRFLAEVRIDDVPVLAHLRDSGRLNELLFPGAEVVVKRERLSVSRKTEWTLYFAIRRGHFFIVNSSLPNELFFCYLLQIHSPERIKREFYMEDVRFDFVILHRGRVKKVIEVKGVNLMKDRKGLFLFPDAPTVRGKHHVDVMTRLARHGKHCELVFVAGSALASSVGLNEEVDPLFAVAVRDAVKAGVRVRAFQARVDVPRVYLNKEIPVKI